MERTNIKILGVIDEDPFSYKTWSGISSYLFKALKQHNYLYDAISAQPPKAVSYLHKVRNFHTDINKWKFKYHLDVDYYRRMTNTALKKIEGIRDDNYNAILQIGAWYDMTGRKDKITISYHDGNLATLLKSPYGYPEINEQCLKRTLDYEKRLYEKLDHIFPMSQWLADSFIKDCGIEPSKITPVGAGINLPHIREIKNKSYDNPNLLFVGKDFERKGGKYLLEAFEIVKKEVKRATLTIIGPTLKGLPEGVRCLNYVSKSTKEGIELLLDEYSSASVFVMPSLYEPFGIVFAEAMAHKLPCIGTRICAMPEIIDDNLTGFLVPVRDSGSLAGRIIALIKEPRVCKEFGENGFKKYVANYTWDSVATKIGEQIRNRF